jgi:hypothetical protein
MPKIKIPGPYHVSFWSNENDEPAHVHVKHQGKNAKFWIGPVRLESSYGYRVDELKKIETLLKKHENEIQEKWDEHFAE